MIDFKMMKDDLKAFNIELEKYKTFSSYNLENLLGDMKALIECVEEAKEMMEVLKKGSFGSYRDPANWLEKYFEEPLGNNGEPIKNPNPELDEDQVELERLKNETV